MSRNDFIKDVSKQTGLSTTKTRELVKVTGHSGKSALLKTDPVEKNTPKKPVKKVTVRKVSRRPGGSRFAEGNSSGEFLTRLEVFAALDFLKQIRPAFLSLNKKMDRSQTIIEKMKSRSLKRQEKIDISLQKLDRLIS
jgi:hypothetical protein